MNWTVDLTWHIQWYDNTNERNSDLSAAKKVIFSSPWLISTGKGKGFQIALGLLVLQ